MEYSNLNLSQNDLPKSLHQWQFQRATDGHQSGQSCLYRKYLFASFESAIQFMDKASRQYISPQNHHPRWQNIYTTIEVWLTTHDVDNQVTEKDIRLAECFELLWQQEFSLG